MKLPAQIRALFEKGLALMLAPLGWFMRLVDPVMRGIQARTGIGGMATVFLAPNMLVFGVFVLLPLIINIIYSVTGGPAIFLSERPYVGSEHYARLFDCKSYLTPSSCAEDAFWQAVHNTGFFVVVEVALLIVVSLITALILNSALKGRGFWRAVFFFPVLLSPVVTGVLWKWILQRDGVLNAFLGQFGMEKTVWLADRGWAMFWAIFVAIWAHAGFYALILLAGLQAIPKDIYEAAAMDGTSRVRSFLRLTLPLLGPNLVVVVVLALIRAIQTFDEVYVLTGGGPGTSTMLLTQYVYEVGFAHLIRNPGVAAAASILMGLCLVVLTLVQLTASSRREQKEKAR